MVTLMLLGHLLLTPTPYPDPPAPPYPTYIVNGDGTRMACAPGGYACWPDDTGLPSRPDGE